MLYHWFLERTSFQFLNMNGAKGKDLYSDTGAVWLQGFPTYLLTYCLCKSFNDRILMLNQSLLKWPQVFLLAVSKDQGLSDWHWAKQMFIRYQNKWIFMTQQCVGKKKQEDWTRLEEEDIYTFLKAFVKTDYVFHNTSLKQITWAFLNLGKLSLSVNQNAISVEFHTAVTASVTADTEERFPSTTVVSLYCTCLDWYTYLHMQV